MSIDFIAIIVAFAFGFLTRLIGLPPMVGYLIAGFVLFANGMEETQFLSEFADIGVTLLLFSIGLKLKLSSLSAKEIWAVSLLHMMGIVLLMMLAILGLALINTPVLKELSLAQSALIAFALSFSSTVFAVKVLEEKGEMSARYGQIAIGILIMQDIAAVVFLAISTGKVPNAWALLLLLLIPARPLIHRMMEKCGHGELLILFGLTLALGGAKIFEMVGVKGDLGALILGLLLSTHPRASELARSLLGFKDLFLVGFFLTIGLSGAVSTEAVLIALLLGCIVPIKTFGFFWLLSRFRLRARTAFLTSLSLFNFSEFGLIVAALAMKNGWISQEWLIIVAISVALSFIISSPFNTYAHEIYRHFRHQLLRFEKPNLLSYEQPIIPGDVSVIIFGMGRVGSGAYNAIQEKYGSRLLGVDFDRDTVALHKAAGRNVVSGSVTDPDFWERFRLNHAAISLIMLAVPSFQENLFAVKQLRRLGYQGKLTVIAKYPDEEKTLKEAGADSVFNLYAEAGAGFAEDCADIR